MYGHQEYLEAPYVAQAKTDELFERVEDATPFEQWLEEEWFDSEDDATEEHSEEEMEEARVEYDKWVEVQVDHLMYGDDF